ncbi:MAG: hypothetical protein B7X10_05635, partial [Burkholderiales bacterium 21-58-4]
MYSGIQFRSISPIRILDGFTPFIVIRRLINTFSNLLGQVVLVIIFGVSLFQTETPFDATDPYRSFQIATIAT